MNLNTIQGWAHLCFLSPYQDGVFRLFRGHVITSDGLNTTYGIAGHYLPDHHDPNHNDCMDPVLFYDTVIKKYDSGSERRLLVRRVAEDDAAGLSTEDDEKNKGQSLSFETERFLVGDKAVQHYRKYLGQEEKDVVVCMGNMSMTLKN